MSDESLKIGDKLKLRREALGLTTIELAKRCDLSEARLMAIEEGFAMPTISTLLKISGEVEVGVGYFFQDDAAREPVEVVRAADRVRVAQAEKEGQSDGLYYNYESLSVAFPGAAMKPFFVEIDLGQKAEVEAATHAGQEFIFVMEGEIEWRSDDENHRLSAGDAIYFNSEIPHKILGLGDTNPRVLAVLWEPGKA